MGRFIGVREGHSASASWELTAQALRGVREGRSTEGSGASEFSPPCLPMVTRADERHPGSCSCPGVSDGVAAGCSWLWMVCSWVQGHTERLEVLSGSCTLYPGSYSEPGRSGARLAACPGEVSLRFARHVVPRTPALPGFTPEHRTWNSPPAPPGVAQPSRPWGPGCRGASFSGFLASCGGSCPPV